MIIKSNWIRLAFILVFCVLATILLFILPYVFLELPVGIDTLAYIYKLESFIPSIRKEPFLIIRSPEFFTFLPLFPLYVIGFKWIDILKFTPMLYAILYALAIYFFVKNGEKDIQISLLSLFFTLVSYSTSLLVTNLYRNTVGLLLIAMCLRSYLLYINEKKKIWLLIMTSVVGYLTLAYPPLFAMLIINLVIFVVISYIIGIGRISDAWTILKACSPLVVIFIIHDIYFLMSNRKELLLIWLFPYLASEFRVGSPKFPIAWIETYSLSAWRGLFVENSILMLLSIIGLFWIVHQLTSTSDHKKRYYLIVISWVFAISAIMLVTDPFGEAYRFPVNFPFGLLASYGFIFIVSLGERLLYSKGNLIKFRTFMNNRISPKVLKFKELLYFVVFFALAVILISSGIARTRQDMYFVPGGLPNQAGLLKEHELQALYWLRDNVEGEVIFIMREPGWEQGKVVNTYIPFAMYTLFERSEPTYYYIGNLTSLLSGEPSFKIPHSRVTETPSYNNLTRYKIVFINGGWSNTFFTPHQDDIELVEQIYNSLYIVRYP